LTPPFLEQALFLYLPACGFLLKSLLPLEVKLPLHRGIPGRLDLLLLALLRQPVDRRIAGESADRAANEHRRRAASEDRATHAGAECGTTHRPHAGTGAAFAPADRQGKCGNDETSLTPRKGNVILLSHDLYLPHSYHHFCSSALTDATISSNERASS
jgi:hypothetical protein